MMRSLSPLFVVTGLLASSFAALAAAPANPARAGLTTVVAAREQRVGLLRDELKSLDSRIEDRVTALVAALQSIGDSKDTKTKVARMKRETIDGLRRTIDDYRQRRAAMIDQLRRPTWNLTAEQKQRVITFFDERIEKRVAQILALQKSLPAEKDYDRYKATGSGWWGTTYEVNEDYRQNQRLTVQTNAQRDELTTALRSSLDRLDRIGRDLQARHAPADEIAKNNALIAERRKQLAAALSPASTPTRSVGRKEAADLDQALKTAVADLRTEFTTLFARYNSAIQETSALNTARAQLAAAGQ